MKYLICYDISEDKIRDKIVKYLEGFSYRIQFSVFTCDLAMEKADKIWKELCSIAGKAKNPLLLMVPVCKSCQKGMKIKGKPLEDGKGYFVV